jgi:hypothetical protein
MFSIISIAKFDTIWKFFGCPSKDDKAALLNLANQQAAVDALVNVAD